MYHVRMNQETLKTLYDYDPAGFLVPKTGPSRGSRIGHMDREGYVRVSYQRRKYYAHRLIWTWHHGEPPRLIDHINRDKADNRIENLRPCTETQNAANAKAPSHNTSGYKGVYFDTDRDKWVARIRFTIDGVRYRRRIGRFDSADEAAIAYNVQMLKYFKEFALLNRVDTPLGKMMGMDTETINAVKL
jgi:hypothetical protein